MMGSKGSMELKFQFTGMLIVVDGYEYVLES